jgi:hypothetical protein
MSTVHMDEGLNMNGLTEVIPVVPSLHLEFPALDGTSKQSLEKGSDVFACPQVISPHVVVPTTKCNCVRSNEFEFLSRLPVFG